MKILYYFENIKFNFLYCTLSQKQREKNFENWMSLVALCFYYLSILHTYEVGR